MKLFIQAFSKLIFTVIVLSVLLFFPAGTIAYAGGWRFIGLLCGMMCILCVLLMLFNPELLRKRLQAKEKQAEQKSVVLYSGLMFISVFVIAGLDFRYGWSHMPSWLIVAGCLMLIVSYVGFGEVQGKAVRYTQTTPAEAADARWLIIDCFGLLSSAYRYGKVSYVGGGFGVGIHNVLEAAVWSIPVVFGPNNKRFAEAQELMAAGGGFEIHQAADFEKYIDRWAANEAVLKQAGEAAGRYVGTKTGATATILRNIHL